MSEQAVNAMDLSDELYCLVKLLNRINVVLSEVERRFPREIWKGEATAGEWAQFFKGTSLSAVLIETAADDADEALMTARGLLDRIGGKIAEEKEMLTKKENV